MFMRADYTPPSDWTGHIHVAGWLVEGTVEFYVKERLEQTFFGDIPS